jgi:hypothetical protein
MTTIRSNFGPPVPFPTIMPNSSGCCYDIDATTFTALATYMIRYVENKSTPSDEGVSSQLVELAKNCKDRYLCELVLTSSLLDRSIRGDGE